QSASFLLFNPPASAVLHPLSLHDALPIFLFVAIAKHLPGGTLGKSLVYGLVLLLVFGFPILGPSSSVDELSIGPPLLNGGGRSKDRKSTRLNSSHVEISYAVFCLKKKNCF